MGFSPKLGREIVRVCDTHLSHQLLLLRWARLASGHRDFDVWGWFGRNWHPPMQFGPEEVCFMCQEDLRAFNLPQIKAHSWNLSRGEPECRCRIWANILPEIGCCFNNIVEAFQLIGNERKTWNLIVPLDEVFKLRPSCIPGYLHTIVTDRTGIFVIFLDLASGYLKTFSMIPFQKLDNFLLPDTAGKHDRHTTHDRLHTQSSSQLQAACRCKRPPSVSRP